MLRSLHTVPRALFLLALGATAAACGTVDDDLQTDIELREIVFETTEVAEAMQAEPDTIFLVDLSEGNVVHFDQADGPIDFSNFMAQCPSMPAPVPMAVFFDDLAFDTEELQARDYFTLQSDLTPRSDFRIIVDGGGNCVERCNAEGTDCVLDCW